jgi:hypothetical protein
MVGEAVAASEPHEPEPRQVPAEEPAEPVKHKHPERPHATERPTPRPPDPQVPSPAAGLNPSPSPTHATREARSSDSAPASTQHAAAQLVEQIRDCVERLMVGVSPTGDVQVRMVLKEPQLPGVQLMVQRDAAQLVVVFETGVAASRQLLDRAASSLAKTLASKFGRDVRVSVLDPDEPAREFMASASAGDAESTFR